MGLNQNDLAGIIGIRSRSSEVLRGEMDLTKKRIRSFHVRLIIPAEILSTNEKNGRPPAWIGEKCPPFHPFQVPRHHETCRIARDRLPVCVQIEVGTVLSRGKPPPP